MSAGSNKLMSPVVPNEAAIHDKENQNKIQKNTNTHKFNWINAVLVKPKKKKLCHKKVQITTAAIAIWFKLEKRFLKQKNHGRLWIDTHVFICINNKQKQNLVNSSCISWYRFWLTDWPDGWHIVEENCAVDTTQMYYQRSNKDCRNSNLKK